jgi:hypothetical protein
MIQAGWDLFCGLQLANFFELLGKTMSQGALMTQLLDQQFGLVEGIGCNFRRREQASEILLNFGFG